MVSVLLHMQAYSFISGPLIWVVLEEDEEDWLARWFILSVIFALMDIIRWWCCWIHWERRRENV